MHTFDREMTADVDRLNALYDGDSAVVQASAVSALVLEYPGLAVVASRSAAVRRPVLASIIDKALTAADDAANQSVIVFANGTKQLLMREVIAAASGVPFFAIDNAELHDEDWAKLVHGVSRLQALTGIEGERSEREAEGLEAVPRIQWSGNPVSVVDVFRALSECEAGSTVVVENAHLLQGADRVSAALSDLRNCAAVAGSFLYLGVGLSHWPDVRKSPNRQLFLTDLPEAYAELVNIADKISLLAPSSEGSEVTIFDPRYVEAWHGPLKL
jgi:hypothetical protein